MFNIVSYNASQRQVKQFLISRVSIIPIEIVFKQSVLFTILVKRICMHFGCYEIYAILLNNSDTVNL